MSNRLDGLIDCAMNQATNCMLDESAKGVWLQWDVGKTLKAEIHDEMRVGNIVALTEFVDSLKEWCDKAEIDKWTAGDLLEFAVQRLELIKGEK